MDIIAARIDLCGISLEKLDLTIYNGKEVLNRFIRFLRTIGNLIIHAGSRSRVININRTETLDLVQFMCQQDLKIEEQDERSITLEEINPSKISLESMLQDEPIIRGEEHLKRLKQVGHIRLDAKIFQTLWVNQHLIPKVGREPPIILGISFLMVQFLKIRMKDMLSASIGTGRKSGGGLIADLT